MGVPNVIRIHISTENAAFHDWTPGHEHPETASILRQLADRIMRDGIPKVGEPYPLIDTNGQNVGSCYVEEGI